MTAHGTLRLSVFAHWRGGRQHGLWFRLEDGVRRHRVKPARTALRRGMAAVVGDTKVDDVNALSPGPTDDRFGLAPRIATAVATVDLSRGDYPLTTGKTDLAAGSGAWTGTSAAVVAMIDWTTVAAIVNRSSARMACAVMTAWRSTTATQQSNDNRRPCKTEHHGGQRMCRHDSPPAEKLMPGDKRAAASFPLSSDRGRKLSPIVNDCPLVNDA